MAFPSDKPGAARQALISPRRSRQAPPPAAARRHGLSDDEVRERVNHELLELARTIFLRIEVGVAKGNVTLRGTVASAYERNLIVRTAKQVEGVQSVRDEIRERRMASQRPPSLFSFVFGGLLSLLAFAVAHLWPAAGSGAFAARRAGTLLAAACVVWWCFWPASLHLVSVRGRLMIDGTPPLGAVLTLHPLVSQIKLDPLPQGQVQPDGTIHWTTKSPGDGLPVGDYAVTVACTPAQAGTVLPGDYTRPERTPLRMTVTPEAAPIVIDIRTKTVGAPAMPNTFMRR
jgi:hypothetical protein